VAPDPAGRRDHDLSETPADPYRQANAAAQTSRKHKMRPISLEEGIAAGECDRESEFRVEASLTAQTEFTRTIQANGPASVFWDNSIAGKGGLAAALILPSIDKQ
jgi:hypothetical protein